MTTRLSVRLILALRLPLHLDFRAQVILGRALLLGHETQSFFEGRAGRFALTPLKALGLELGFAGGADHDFNEFSCGTSRRLGL